MKDWILPVLVASILAIGCSKNPDEVEIRQILDTIRTSAEQKAFEQIVPHLTEDYSDNLGNNAGSFEPQVKRQTKMFDKLTVHMVVEKIEIQNNSASAFTKIKVEGIKSSKKERLIGSPLSGRRLQVDFEKRSGKWRVVGSALALRGV